MAPEKKTTPPLATNNEPAVVEVVEQSTDSLATQPAMTVLSVGQSPSSSKTSPNKSSQTSKPVYKTTPHTRKGASASSPKGSNTFSVLGSSDEEVESLILKAKQTRKTVHPRLLGTGSHDSDSCEL